MQQAWALVNRRGWVLSHTMRHQRKDVISRMLREYDGMRKHKYQGLSDAQFWRKLKRDYGWTVRRVELRIK